MIYAISAMVAVLSAILLGWLMPVVCTIEENETKVYSRKKGIIRFIVCLIVLWFVGFAGVEGEKMFGCAFFLKLVSHFKYGMYLVLAKALFIALVSTLFVALPYSLIKAQGFLRITKYRIVDILIASVFFFPAYFFASKYFAWFVFKVIKLAL